MEKVVIIGVMVLFMKENLKMGWGMAMECGDPKIN